MSLPIVTLDIDGVLADTGYIPSKMHTSWEPYINAKPMEGAEELIDYLHDSLLDPWYITARSFPGAEAITKAWMFKNLQVWTDKILFCHKPNESYVPKHIIANELGSVLHVDDDWRVFVGADHQWKVVGEDRTRLHRDSTYSRQPFLGQTLWIDNWKNKSSIPLAPYQLIDSGSLLSAPATKEALTLVKTITPSLL